MSIKLSSRSTRKPQTSNHLYAELHTLGQLKLCERLEKYISRSLAEVFNSQTNIKLDNRLVIFDVKDLPESLRQIMMLIISNFVKNQVIAKPEKHLLIIDEGWMLLEHEESARFVSRLVVLPFLTLARY